MKRKTKKNFFHIDSAGQVFHVDSDSQVESKIRQLVERGHKLPITIKFDRHDLPPQTKIHTWV